MAITLEASLTIPLTVLITIGIIQSAIILSVKCVNEIEYETESVLLSTEGKSTYTRGIREDISQDLWSETISARPVRLKQTISIAKDTVNLITEYVSSFSDLMSFEKSYE